MTTRKTIRPALCGLAVGAAAIGAFFLHQPSAHAQGATGMTVYVNPQTGEILAQPVPGGQPLTLSPEEQNAASTSHEGLVEVPAPGGGYMLDLQGRFQNPLAATIDASGRLRVQHLPNLPPVTVQGSPR